MTRTLLTRGSRHGMSPDRSKTEIVAPWVWLTRNLRRLDERLSGRQVEEPRTDEEVLAWVRRIAATEPRYAADLHAAVLRKQALEGY